MKTLRYGRDGVTTVKGVSTAELVEDDETGLWVAEVYGRSVAECRERADRIIASVAACRALPDPERDVAALLEMLTALTDAAEDYFEDDGTSGLATFARFADTKVAARALLARIHVDQEPEK